MRIILLLMAVMLLMTGADARYSPGLEIAEGENITLDEGLIKNLQSDGVYNPMAYGAIPDDGIDDAAAIQLAANASHAAGGGIVFIPPGEFLLNSSQYDGLNGSVLIRAWPNVTFQGAGKYLTKLKVGDSYRQNYRGLCPILSVSEDGLVANWSIRDMTIDFNGENNKLEEGWSESDWCSIGGYPVSNVTFENLLLTGCPGLNVINIYSTNIIATCNNALVRNVEIVLSGNEIESGMLSDFSAIYSCVSNTTIENCYIHASEDFLVENACAIEIHSPDSIVRDNVIRNYRNGVYITSDGANEEIRNMRVINNNFRTAYHGVSVWLGDQNFTDIHISRNNIDMIPDATMLYSMGISHCFEAGTRTSGSFTNELEIDGNIITFPSPYDNDRSWALPIGIASAYANDSMIKNNVIRNGLIAGIWSKLYDNATIAASGNTITNCGMSTNANATIQAGMVIQGAENTGNAVLTGNDFSSGEISYYTPAVYIYSSADLLLNAEARHNTVNWTCQDEILTGTISSSSVVITEDSANAAPSSGFHSVGSIRWNAAPTAGGAALWMCTVAGSPGTWKACNLAS